jgi:CRP-like cAMP-binding protein
VSHTSTPRGPRKNQILHQLPDKDREALLTGASDAHLGHGHTVARAGDAIAGAYFPDTGVISLVREMTTGHQVGVGAVGSEGVIGVDSVLGQSHYSYRMMVLSESRGCWIAADRFKRAFDKSEALRHLLLPHIGDRLSDAMITAACNRAHSHQQRLARWLLLVTDKAGERSLHVTHDSLAQIVGGPRHAVTVALNQLRKKGAISHLRGRLDIVRRSVLIEQACECYRLHGRHGRARAPR